LILVADDQPDVLQALRILLKAEGFRTKTASSPQEILEAVAESAPDLLLIDLNYSRDTTSGDEGLELLDRLSRFPAPPPILVMTAWGSIELAVEAMRRGARDFVLKPWENQKLVETIRRHLSAPREQRQEALRELSLARQVQQEMLPKQPPAIETAILDAACWQAGAVGGDAYDFYPSGTGGAAFSLSDISGKGLPAAMLMAHLIATLRTLMTRNGASLAERVNELHRQFRQATGPERFATLFLGDFDPSTRRLAYVNCGHPAPILMRKNGAVERLEPTCPVLGLLPGFSAHSATVPLAAGDTLAVFSDGIPDAPTGKGEFGEEGLLRLLAEHPNAGAADLTSLVAQQTQRPQFDDMTLVLLRAR
jgi:sigma-B regulation protein RsbU (phosphoserine phosphatase)